MDVDVIVVELDEVISVIGEVCGYHMDQDDHIFNDIINIAEKCFDHVLFSSSTFLVAFSHDKTIVGSCGLSFTNGLHIDVLCVDPPVQNNGIGTAILTKALEIGNILNTTKPGWIDLVTPYGNGVFPMTQKNQLTLEVDRQSTNYKKLTAFYTKNGFQMATPPGMLTYCRKLIP